MNAMEMAFGGLKVIKSLHMKEKRPVIELSRIKYRIFYSNSLYIHNLFSIIILL